MERRGGFSDIIDSVYSISFGNLVKYRVMATPS